MYIAQDRIASVICIDTYLSVDWVGCCDVNPLE